MSTFVLNKKSYCFCGGKKKEKKCRVTGHLWTHEKKLPPRLFVWLRATAGENRNKAVIAHDKPQAVKPVMERLWIYATISHNCAKEFPFPLKNLLFGSVSLNWWQKKPECPWQRLNIDPQGWNRLCYPDYYGSLWLSLCFKVGWQFTLI